MPPRPRRLFARPLFFSAALALASTALVAASPRSAAADSTRAVETRRLANGLRVLLVPDPSADDVAVLVRYGTGSRDEPRDSEGLAHLVEHAMFRGSRHVSASQFKDLLSRAGASSMNAATTRDGTQYFESVPPERLALALWIESDRMAYPLEAINEESFLHERSVVMSEHRERITESPLSGLEGVVYDELFPRWHPYRHGVAGTPMSLGSISLRQVRSYVATWYVPANATLVLSGKVDASAWPLVEQYFATIPARPLVARPALPELPPHAEAVLTVAAPVTRETVRMAWVSPPLGASGDAELDAVAMLVGSVASWMRRRLMLDTPHIALALRAHQTSMALASVFQIEATAAEGHTADELVPLIEEGLARLARGLTEDDLAAARTRIVTNRLFELESHLTWASRAAVSFAQDTPTVFDGDMRRYTNLTVEGVRAAIGKYLPVDRRALVFVRSKVGAPTGGALVRREEVAR